LLKPLHYIWIFFGTPISIYLMVIISGDYNWFYGNLFTILTVLSVYITSIYLLIYNKGLLIERFNFKSTDQESKDKHFVGDIGKYLLVFYYIILPFSHRYALFGHFNEKISIISAFLLSTGYIMIFIVFKQNSYASPIIRNQKERNHEIITSGLYSLVRHPMYTACVLIFIFTPLMLNSYLGLIFGFLLSLLFCKRINVEEEFLIKEFSSYKSYQSKVKYKIFPYIY
tara:strand:+ start:391 stop:1071 length:681 start_codon:yes stop_codon:yes gene_type:complete